MPNKTESKMTPNSPESYERLNAQLKAIFDSSVDGIWVADHQGLVININRASEELSGVKAESLIGRHIKDIVEMGAFDNPVTMEILKTKQRVTRVQYAKKTKRTLICTGTPVFDEKGEIILVVVNERDITQLNDMKDQL
ncbi:MAG: PAS domain S-box protein, partial [Deltaproteobacteria bacterium]|nr:PAS domain S-box protein [Deltaproteobacteria bacterium]